MRRRFGLLTRAALLFGGLLLAGGAWPAVAEQENVGRWQHGLRRCQITIGTVGAAAAAQEAPPAAPMAPAAAATPPLGTSHGCSALRLDQLLEGLLTVRLVSAAAAGAQPSQQLVFAGVLAGGSAPMRCRDGRCRPRWPLRLQVSAVAQSGYDPRGLALGLPASHLARGECLLERRRLRCSASGSGSGSGGLTWSASADL